MDERLPKCKCVICGDLYQPTRRGMKYCSRRCRQWAYDNRKRVLKKAARNTLSDDSRVDVQAIRRVSAIAADSVVAVAAVAGREMAEVVLDGLWDLLTRLSPDDGARGAV